MATNAIDVGMWHANPPLPRYNANLVNLTADRFDRAESAHNKWAAVARNCVDFVEGRQWSADDLAKMDASEMPAITLNKIKPLVKLVLGYFSQNRTDVKFMPAFDDTGSDAVSKVLSMIEKHTEKRCAMPYVDGEVFLDGIITGRGFYDTRLNQNDNVLGEVKTRALDPFSTYLDPDGQSYDVNESGFLFISRWISLGDVWTNYGEDAMKLASHFVGTTGASGMPANGRYPLGGEEIRPPTGFGGYTGESDSIFAGRFDRWWDYIDVERKAMRLLEMQHYVTTPSMFFVDLETGDAEIVPDDYTRDDIVRTLTYAQQVGNPLRMDRRLHRRLRITHTMADILLYDDWSLDKTMTVTPYFPWFRHGATQGMVEALLDPQREHNKQRSSRLLLLMRAATGGWLYEKTSLSPEMKEHLERYGSTPGVHIEYNSHGGSVNKPEQIEPPGSPEDMKRLDNESADDMKSISNINDSALGQVDRVQSGRAIESRQRQAIIGIEWDIVAYKRSKELLGAKHLEMYQRHYDTPRVMRITGADGNPVTFQINQITAGAQEIKNDITVGTYMAVVDTTPAAATFLEAQFNEVMLLREKGIPIPDDIVLRKSSLGNDEDVLQRVAMVRQALGIPPNVPAIMHMPPPGGAPGGAPGEAPSPPRAGGGGATSAPGSGGPPAPPPDNTGAPPEKPMQPSIHTQPGMAAKPGG